MVDVVAEVESQLYVAVSKIIFEGHQDECLGLFWRDIISS
jgi:hypothetical protein